MSFDPLQLPPENLRVHWDSNSQNESPLGSVQVHSLTLSYTPESMKCDSQASLLVRTFASPCLGCKPKVRVTTFLTYYDYGSINSINVLFELWLKYKNEWGT